MKRYVFVAAATLRPIEGIGQERQTAEATAHRRKLRRGIGAMQHDRRAAIGLQHEIDRLKDIRLQKHSDGDSLPAAMPLPRRQLEMMIVERCLDEDVPAFEAERDNDASAENDRRRGGGASALARTAEKPADLGRRGGCVWALDRPRRALVGLRRGSRREQQRCGQRQVAEPAQ
ncbi:MAG TPA: hypothetical protein VMA53_04625 [Stellaceae bacterium]|nr:hypothetical protein [Stellaceae bacterium]